MTPLTHALKRYPTQVDCQFQQQPEQVALNQVCAVDTLRLVKQLGHLDEAAGRAVCAVLGRSLRDN